MSVSRPPSPPSHATINEIEEVSIEVTIEPSSPMSTSSTDSASSIASARESRKSSTSAPTNTLIITPLPLPFFEPRILEALKGHFASFSTTFIHRRSPYSPVSAPGPGASIKGDRQGQDADIKDGASESSTRSDDHMSEEQSAEGDLYSFVPLKSFRRAIVVYYTAEDAERARVASDRLHIPETVRCPAVILRAFRGPETVLVEEGWFPGTSRRDGPQAISDDAEEGSWYFGGYPMLPSTNFDDGEIRESPFHLRPPVPERNFLISPPGSPPVGWVPAREDPPNEVPLAQDLMEALERLKAQNAARSRRRPSPREAKLLSGSGSRSRSHSISTDGGSMSHSEDEDGVMLIPESAAGLCVRVEDWGTRRLVRLHQTREKGKRRRANSGSIEGPDAKRSKSDNGEDVERGALTEMEDELDQELDDARYKTTMVDWNRIDHARIRVETTLRDENDDIEELDIQIEMEEDEEDSRFLAQSTLFSSGRDITVKMPKLGVKPKPASMPPLQPEVDVLGRRSGSLGFTATAMPPLQPTAMPPRTSDSSA